MNINTDLTFNKATNVKYIDIQVPGWLGILSIKYGIYYAGTVVYYMWQVVGTKKIFRVPATVLYKEHGECIEEHFIATLATLRFDFLEWMREGFQEKWMQDYADDLGPFVDLYA